MGTHVMVIGDARRESLRGTVLASIGLHIALFVLAATWHLIGFRLGGGGTNWGASGATKIGAVASLPGVPLPTPLQTTPSQVVTQNLGQHKTEPEPKEEPPPKAE